jgi:peptide chain release factor 2
MESHLEMQILFFHLVHIHFYNKQHKELLKRVLAIQSYLKIEEKRMQLREEELRTQDPSFWDDPKKAEAKMKDIRGLKFWVETFDRVKGAADDLEIMFETKSDDG